MTLEHEYFFAHPPHKVSTDKMWITECMSVANWCVGYGLDPGAGMRTFSPDLVTVDVRRECNPQFIGHAESLRGLIPCAEDIDFSKLVLPAWYRGEAIEDDTFDFVFTSHLLEHLPDPRAAIREWLRVVKPGGHVCIIIPDTAYTLTQNTDATPHLHEWKARDFTVEVLGAELGEFVSWWQWRGLLDWCDGEVVWLDQACPRWSVACVIRKGGR